MPAGSQSEAELPHEVRAALRSAGDALGTSTEGVWLTLQVEQADDTERAPAGHVIAARQRELTTSALTGRSVLMGLGPGWVCA